MSQKKCSDNIIDIVLTNLSTASSDVEITRDIILNLSKSAFDQVCMVNPNWKDYDINFTRICEKILSIHSAGTTVNSHISFRGEDHIQWLDAKRHKIRDGIHWNAFKRYLGLQISEIQIRELDSSTDYIVGSIEDPERQGSWHSRGLVIGDVQSGKTTNFIGVLNKAIDTGYKVIVVLSGIHNSLRMQTQKRFEEGISGWNTSPQNISEPYCGVALIQNVHIDRHSLRIGHLTTRENDGDFLGKSDPGLILGRDCLFSVNKKNFRNLENLKNFFIKELKGDVKAENIPFVLIDDEADNASIDTSKPEDDKSSRINGLIKDLLNLFPKNAYIGYTATPFANVLINREEKDDFFPRNFIQVLGRPENYIGPHNIFGTIIDDSDENEDKVQERETDFDWFVNLDHEPYGSDWKEYIPYPNKNEDNLEYMRELPFSIKSAIFDFIISIAIRNVRGDKNEFKTMLIHITRFTDLQGKIIVQVEEFIEEVINDFMIPSIKGKTSFLNPIQKQFERNFSNIKEDFNEIQKELPDAVISLRTSRLHVFGINGERQDVINEEEWPNGLNSIWIGGEKLSRGLTLPGLITSYFLRTSRMYDTLMQMGRWFGYRENYDDLCRIYTTARLFNMFGHVANASEGLRSRIKDMNRIGLKPDEYQQQIQSHSGNMLVTALNKQRYTREINLSFSGDVVQLTSFSLSQEKIDANNQNEDLIFQLFNDINANKKFVDKQGARVFQNVSRNDVITFIENFHHEREAGTWKSGALVTYIKEMSSKGELVNWSIAFQSSTRPDNGSTKKKIGNYTVWSNIRAGFVSENNLFTMKKQGMVSANHEKFDLSDFAKRELKGKERSEIKKKRAKENALLIVYLITPKINEEPLPDAFFSVAICFPETPNASGIRHIVNDGDFGVTEEEQYD